MKKQFFAAAMILALGAGFTACSNDDLGKQEGKEVARSASTYMTVTFEMPRVNSTRAASDGQDKPQPDFNNIGEWSGQDKVTSFTLYVFNGNTAASTLEVMKTYQAGSFTTPTVSGKVVVKPNDAFLVSPGQKRVFVVINPTAEVTTHLNATEGTTTLSAFETQYKDAEFAPTWATSPLAKHVDAVGTTPAYDEILMTGASADQSIANNISATDAISGAANNVPLKVQRAAAGVIVTSKDASYNIKGMDPATHTMDNSFVKVSDLSFVVGQTNKKLYLLQKANTPAAPATTVASAFKTPAYDYVPTATTVATPVAFATTASTHFDYSGLGKSRTAPAGTTLKTNGFEVVQLASHALTDVTPKLPNVQFLLPTTHNYDASRDASGYRKGNTPYVLVRGYLTPKTYVKDDGTIVAPTDAIADLYYGESTGLFYASDAAAQDAAHHGVAGQKVRKFTNRVVLYWAWLNPDANNVNSPVIRNNIYHIQITAIGNLGGNWNPLVPGGSNNPDPEPNNPNKPDTPPVKPEDPLTLDKTWMSANVTLLPWQVHSTEVTLSL